MSSNPSVISHVSDTFMNIVTTVTSTGTDDPQHNYTDKQQLLLTIINECNQSITGRRKLMKLVFFAEHYNTNTHSVESTPRFGAFTDFVMTTNGVTSRSVITTYNNLKDDALITEQRPTRLNLTENTVTIELTDTACEHFNPQDTQFNEMIDMITTLATDDGDTLHNFSLFILGLTPNTYQKHIADDIQTILNT